MAAEGGLPPSTAMVTFQHWAGVRPHLSFFKLTESCVFSKQSLPSLYLACYAGTRSSEVTGLVCRVPSAVFSRCLGIFYQPTRVSLVQLKFRERAKAPLPPLPSSCYGLPDRLLPPIESTTVRPPPESSSRGIARRSLRCFLSSQRGVSLATVRSLGRLILCKPAFYPSVTQLSLSL